MLIQFSFKNYKSFKEENTLDLSATKQSEYSDRVISVGGEKGLPVAAIYGANASGKSNVYRAFECMRRYVISSFSYGGDDNSPDESGRPVPFLFSSETEKADTSFEVYFTIPGDRNERVYKYGFSVGGRMIHEEWLYSRAKTATKFTCVFERGETIEPLNLIGIPKEARDNIEISLEPQVLVVSLGAKLKVEKCKLVRDWFLRALCTDFADRRTNYRTLPPGFTDNPSVRTDVVRFLSSFDESIRGFRVEKIPADSAGSEYYKVVSIHKKDQSEERTELPLADESAGTLKMFSLYTDLRTVLHFGGVFFVDELNARLHPLLVRNVILTFLNPETNPLHAQLIFTTHDTWQLSTHLLRRDEIWFTEKGEDEVSSLYSLADFVDEDGVKIRKDESYEKNYLLGKYGAIPSLKTIDLLKGGEGFVEG